MSRQTTSQVKQSMAVVFTVLLVVSMVGGFMFTGTAAANTIQSTQTNTNGQQNPVPNTQSQTTNESQEAIGTTNIQPQTQVPDSVSIPTTIQDFEVEMNTRQKISDGRYNISGTIKAIQPKPIVPVGHSASVEIYVFENADDTLVAHDEQNILLEPGSVHPYKIQVGDTEVLLHKTHENNTGTSPLNMSVNASDTDGDGEDEYRVVNKDNEPVVTRNGNNLINETQQNISAVRDPYISQFGFNLGLSKSTEYRYELYFTGSNATDSANDYTSGEDPANLSINPGESGSIPIENPVSSTDISSNYNVLTNTRYRNGSDVTYATSYKSTQQQSEKEIYEELALPTRGTPTGTVTAFANALDNNGEFAAFKPDSGDALRITTSTQTIPANAPQTLAIRYTPPGDGNVSVVSIDSSGDPIDRDAGNSLGGVGYLLPNDTSTVDYATGTTSTIQTNTNVALISLSDAERRHLNNFGELFLSFEARNVSDDFRLYCQSVLTGTVNRDIDACGINTSSVDNYSNGVISNLTIYPSPPSDEEFDGEITNGHSKITGVSPGNEVEIRAELHNAGTEPINTTFTLFKNTSDSGIFKNSTTKTIDGPAPITETKSFNKPYAGRDVTITSDISSRDGTITINVSNDNGDKETFVYDGHSGTITESLNGMSASDTWTIDVETEINTGERDPVVNEITIAAKPVNESKALKTPKVSLEPGETETKNFTTVPSTNITYDKKVIYTGHFYDNKEQVVAVTDAQTGDTKSPTAIISGSNTLYSEPAGSTTTRIGTQTIESTTCPTANTVTCPSGSEWERTETNTGTASSETQTMHTTKTGIPLNQSLVGTGAYQGSLLPLTRAGVQDPYKNLPGDKSEWTLQKYGVQEVTSSETIKATESEMASRYGSVEKAYKAGWTISERNVGEAVVDTRYRWFRAIDAGQSIAYGDEEFVIDRTTDDWTRITRQQYSYMDLSEPLTKTRTTAVRTLVQHENPDNESIEDENWKKTEQVEYIVNRSEEAGVEQKRFHSSPGGDWKLVSSFSCYYDDGCLYERPKIAEEYWTYEWTLEEERDFRLHKKKVTEAQHTWTQNLYDAQMTWTRTISGDIHKYTGPEYIEFTNYGSAKGTYNGENSKPSSPSATITDYDWTINGESLETTTKTKEFTETREGIIQAPENIVNGGEGLGNYEFTEEFNITKLKPDDAKLQFQPNELNLHLTIDDQDEGSVQIKITDDNGRSRKHIISGREVPYDGEMTLNLAEMGFPQHSETYTVEVSGTSGIGETVPAVNEVELKGIASRGGDTVSVSQSGTGSFTLGLTVTDSYGFTDTTRKTVNLERCGPTQSCHGGDPWIQLNNAPQAVDYRSGLAQIEASVGGIDGNDFYVVELTPPDITTTSENQPTCPTGSQKYTASQIHDTFDEWEAGIDKENVVEENNPYCVYIGASGHSPLDMFEVVPSLEPTTEPVRTVWEGSTTSRLSGDDISFNINPRVNNLIDRGNTEFTLTLRKVGSDTPAQTWNFEVFFCDALNGEGSDSRSTAPENRTTRYEGGLVCPNLNSDFDSFGQETTVNGTTYAKGDPATDSLDACPYDPGKQKFVVKYGVNDGYCETNFGAGEVGVVWDSFENPQEASKHMVYYDRYNQTVQVNTSADTYSKSKLKLGYSPLEQDSFADTNLYAYYPLSEESFKMNHVPVNSDFSWQSYDGDNSGYDKFDISFPLPNSPDANSSPQIMLGDVAVPWKTFNQVMDDRGNLSQYPYKNLWVAADISGNNYHAPIFHTQTRMEVKQNRDCAGCGHKIITQDYYRGDMSKTLQRGKGGVYGSGSYKFDSESYLVPYKFQSNRAEGYDGYTTFCDGDVEFGVGDGDVEFGAGDVEVGDGDVEVGDGDGEAMCFSPRDESDHKPIGGPGWNQGLGVIQNGDSDFTISMYIRPPDSAASIRSYRSDTADTQTFFSFYDWNGWDDGGYSEDFVSYASTTQKSTSGWRSTFGFLPGEDTDTTVFGVADHSSHGWPTLPSMIEDPVNSVYRPGAVLDDPQISSDEAKVQNMKLWTTQSSASISAPPEMVSPRANHYNEIRAHSDTGYGTNWRHMAVSVSEGEQITYYIDGLPYTAEISRPKGYSDGFTGLKGTQTSLLIGASMERGANVKENLQGFSISDLRIYNTDMTQGQVQEHLLIDDATYVSRTQNITDNLERYTLSTAGDQTKAEVVEQMLQSSVNPDDMRVVVNNTKLNGGAINITARPVSSDNSDIDKGSITLTLNATTNVENPEYFTDISYPGPSSMEASSTNAKYYPNPTSECSHEYLHCFAGTESGGETIGIEKYPLPSFVAEDILYALDNGTINLETAWQMVQHYDKNQDFRYQGDGAEDLIYFSAGEGVTLEDMGISRKEDFKKAIGYERKPDKGGDNNLKIADDEAVPNNWEISVRIQSRPHTHQSPKIGTIKVATDGTSKVSECETEENFVCES